MDTGSSSDMLSTVGRDSESELGGAAGSSSASAVHVDVGAGSKSARGWSRSGEKAVVVWVPSSRETEMAPSQQRALKEAGATVVPVQADECVVLDVKSDGSNEPREGGESSESQCRICHLGSELEDPDGSELILLGCDCKGELGMAHRHCAENWFILKGDRICEICGAHAKNITGTEFTSFMEAWSENRVCHFAYHRRYEERRHWRDQPLCKFVLAFVIVAFILPWIVRANMN